MGEEGKMIGREIEGKEVLRVEIIIEKKDQFREKDHSQRKNLEDNIMKIMKDLVKQIKLWMWIK